MRILSVFLAMMFSLSSSFHANAENSVTMYASDGRTVSVPQSQTESYQNADWYEHIYDVTVSMYNKDGVLESVYVDDAPQKIKDGYTYAKSDTTQMMFADDGRIIYVPNVQVPKYLSVNWYRGGGKLDPSRPMIALTFDDGPAKYTEQILACLEKYGARATFFVQGKSVSRYPESVKRAVNIGCEIGNHTWGHLRLTTATQPEIEEQLKSTNQAVFDITGVYPKLFRPPWI